MTPQEHPILLILFVIFGITFLVQIFYYLYFFMAPLRFRHSDVSSKNEPVSVIICARNEENNLRAFLPAILEQDYHDYEVIVVNDCSDDESFEVLGEYLKKYRHLKVTNILKDPKFTHNKKFAQFIGIKAAKNELLVFTDADCRPESDKWLRNIAGGFDPATDFVLGYGGYFASKGFLNKYIRYDCMVIAMQYLGMAIKGMPYMGVGRNLAYRRSFFFERKGFGSHTNLASGDDDLFVNENVAPGRVMVEFRKESHTRSVPASAVKDFFRQKRRHLTTANYYKIRDKLVLITEPATRILFYSLFIILLANLFLWPLVIGTLLARFAVQLTILILIRNRFNEPGLLPFMLIFDILSPFINSVIYISSQRQSAYKIKWN
jgi:glycosyltransferase involved in cell wall biosynthesis